MLVKRLKIKIMILLFEFPEILANYLDETKWFPLTKLEVRLITKSTIVKKISGICMDYSLFSSA